MKSSQDIGEALSRVRTIVEDRDEIHVVHSSELKRKDRELLVKKGWLQEVIKGWYLFVRPDTPTGHSSAWFANFWDFLYVYLNHFYGKEYCLSAEHSLDLYLGETVVPKQITIIAPKGRGYSIELPFDTSVLIYKADVPLNINREVIRKLQVMSLPLALCKVSPTFFQKNPRSAEIALQSIKNGEDLLRVMVSKNFIRAAGRLVGAYRFLGNKRMVSELLKGLNTANMRIQETNPFVSETPLLLNTSLKSPYAMRIISMWHQYRQDVIKYFPKPPGLPANIKNYLEQVEEKYTQDAYHSLSIEGYQVNPKLIEKVKKSGWQPDSEEDESQQHNTLAARGYYEAFLLVKESLGKILSGITPGKVIESDLSEWYRGLFNPNQALGIITSSDLFGYRRHQVYIRNSRHTPFPPHVLTDAMEALFTCLKEEEHAGVRAILGHFIFVFIHPYMDGNGRIGRFLMNTMLGSGGYPWIIVHSDSRIQYLHALEEASTKENIIPFAQFLCQELSSI